MSGDVSQQQLELLVTKIERVIEQLNEYGLIAMGRVATGPPALSK